jgi:hypothetical protein
MAQASSPSPTRLQQQGSTAIGLMTPLFPAPILALKKRAHVVMNSVFPMQTGAENRF